MVCACATGGNARARKKTGMISRIIANFTTELLVNLRRKAERNCPKGSFFSIARR